MTKLPARRKFFIFSKSADLIVTVSSVPTCDPVNLNSIEKLACDSNRHSRYDAKKTAHLNTAFPQTHYKSQNIYACQ